jgi:hypothetical protein
MAHCRRLMLRRLVDRLALAATLLALFVAPAAAQIFDPPDPPGGNTVPIVVDPIAPGLGPIALPPFVVGPPQGTVPVEPPDPGELPSDLPQLSGSAELRAVDFQTPFHDAHAGAALTVASTIGADSYAVTIDLDPAGDDFARYTVSEDLNHIDVSYTMHDGTRSRVIASHELIGPLDGGLVHARFLSDVLTSLVVTSQITGETSTFQPASSSLSSAGLSSPARLQALDDLVAANLAGPAAPAALDAFRAALGGYLARIAPETGDFNQDGVIDAADYVTWRKDAGNIYTPAHYYAWRAGFGHNLGSGATDHASVPEPATLLLAIAIVAIRLRKHL